MESDFQSRALQYLNSLPGCRAENVSGNAMQSGRPDINGCLYGRMFKIELKIPDHKNSATKKQELELRKWSVVGAAVGVLYSMDALKVFMEHLQHSTFSDCRVKITFPEENDCESWFQI